MKRSKPLCEVKQGGQTVRKMFRINVSFARNIRIHVKKFGEKLDSAFRANVNGLHDGDHESDQELHVNVRVDGQTIRGKDAPLRRHLARRAARAVERRWFD